MLLNFLNLEVLNIRATLPPAGQEQTSPFKFPLVMSEINKSVWNNKCYQDYVPNYSFFKYCVKEADQK